ncbi:MAG: histidine--tRNA ligase [Planctomycetes bacterium]|nr:histidine--tRNA ligase [Planctomycetota bacterium]
MPRKVEPRLLKGFRDYLPEVMIPRTRLLRAIAGVFERFGFEPLDTPTIEYADILLAKAGPEQEKLIYRFKDHGERDVALRYELTISLARVLAQYSTDLPRPFKRYQMGPVWRADAPGKGRYREFWQCDVDIVGTPSLLADAECLAVDHAVMMEAQKLRPADEPRTHVIRFNNRKLFRALQEKAGITDDAIMADVIRAIDKLDKIGKEGAFRELAAHAGLNKTNLGVIATFLNTMIDVSMGNQVRLDLVGAYLGSEIGKLACQEIATVLKHATEMGVPSERLKFDPTIARGLDYYTGTVFETFLTDAMDYGSVMSGGRYDGLVGVFANQDEPAVGISVGIDRLITVLDEKGILKKSKSSAQVLVTIFDASSAESALKLAQTLRAAGINAELYLDKDAKLKKQLAYAQRKEIPWVVIAGPDETARGEVTLRDMKTGQQQPAKVDGLATTIQGRV